MKTISKKILDLQEYLHNYIPKGWNESFGNVMVVPFVDENTYKLLNELDFKSIDYATSFWRNLNVQKAVKEYFEVNQ